jgi:O-antigen ligase
VDINLKTSVNTIFTRLALIDQRNHHWVIGILVIFFLLLPFGFMTVKSLFGLLSAFCLLLSMLALWLKTESRSFFLKEKYSFLIIACLTAAPISILSTQAIRNEFSAPALDGPIRLTLALVILLAIYKHKIDFSKILSISIPPALLAILLFALLGNNPYIGRLTNHYLDPIIWGNFSMILGFMSLAGIQSNDHLALKLYKLSGLALGLCMSLLSGSRAGWVAAVVMTFILLALNRKKITIFKTVTYIFVLALALFTLYFFIESFKLRIDSAIFEFLEWQKDSQRDSGTSIRLNMLKISSHLFILSPWIGFGEFSNLPLEKITTINSFADPGSIFTIQCCGPHNDFAAHALKFGVFGIFSFVLTYLVPINIFLKSKHSQSTMMGIMLCTGILICGFFSEMQTLKVTYTFYAVFISGLIATTLVKNNEKN